MAPSRAPSKQLLRSLKSLELGLPAPRCIRPFSSSCARDEDQAQVQRESFYRNPQPETVYNPRLERKLFRAGTPPIGPRRRRMALATSQGVPFEQLPFQCFQEARKVLIEDRQEKLQQIDTMRKRLTRVQQENAQDAYRGGEAFKQKKIESMTRELERLKILADINDPNVKRRFEDGKGDMSKPIYRYLANRKWQEYKRKIQLQRVTQMKVIPDVVPHCDPIVDIDISFGRKTVQSGGFVDSAVSEQPCQLKIQTFDKDPKLVTIAIVDPDVPDLANDDFDTKCIFLAKNIELTPTNPVIDLAKLAAEQTLISWVPPTAQKGSPYHRLSIVVLRQKEAAALGNSFRISNSKQANSLSVRKLIAQHKLYPIGATLFRTQWDENMAAVMTRAGIDGADMELKRVKLEPLPYTRRDTRRMR